MSTDFRPLTPVRMADLFDGRLKDVGVREQHSEEATSNRRCLTDGRNFLWVYCNGEGLVSGFARYGMNAPQRILQAIADEFGVHIVSEYEPQFWGYETTEEWEAAWAAMVEKDEHNFLQRSGKVCAGRGPRHPAWHDWNDHG